MRAGGDWRFWGVWDSREEAVEWASGLPWPVGYDTSGIAQQHVPIFEQMHLFDYPAMHWVTALLSDRMTDDDGDVRVPCVFDIGGHLGLKKQRYSERSALPNDLRWVVGETDTLVAEAKEALKDHVPDGVEITRGFDRLGEADVVFASGVLQYLDVDLPELLFKARPAGVVVNKVPLSHDVSHWTLERSAHAVVPYHVFHREAFIGRMRDAGYEVVDEWRLGYRVEIPYHPDRGTKYNSGAAFRRVDIRS